MTASRAERRDWGAIALGVSALAGLALSAGLLLATAAGGTDETTAPALDIVNPGAPVAEAAEGLAMSVEEARGRPDILLRAVLEQIYRAFEAEDELSVYDALAVIGGRDVVTDLYLQKRRTLVSRNAEGVTQSLHAIELEQMSSQVVEDGFVIDARWRVLGVIAHATHAHMRGNGYSATLWIARADERWRLDRFELRSIDRRGAGEIITNAE